MKHKARVLTLMLLASMAARGAEPALQPKVILEDAVESRSDLVRLPPGDTGPVYVSGCGACSLQITAETQFFLNKSPLTLVRFRQLASSEHRLLMIYHPPKQPNVTRLVLGDTAE